MALLGMSIPDFFHFWTLHIFEKGHPVNWIGVVGYILVLIWIYYRITSRKRTSGGSGGGSVYYQQ